MSDEMTVVFHYESFARIHATVGKVKMRSEFCVPYLATACALSRKCDTNPAFGDVCLRLADAAVECRKKKGKYDERMTNE